MAGEFPRGLEPAAVLTAAPAHQPDAERRVWHHAGHRELELRVKPDGTVTLTNVGGGLAAPVASVTAGVAIAERVLRMLRAGGRR